MSRYILTIVALVLFLVALAVDLCVKYQIASLQDLARIIK